MSERPIIAPLWDDLDIGSNTNLTYVLTGVIPNRVFTVQWANVHWGFNAEDPCISFQAKLYETTNIIEFVYKQEPGETSTPAASIGLTAARTGIGNFLSLASSTASPSTSSTAETTNIAARPATNQIYRFTPLDCIAPSITDLSDVTATSATFSWNAVPGASGYEYATSITASPPASGTATSQTTINLNGLTDGVNNYFYVRTSCGDGNFSEWSRRATVVCTTNTAPANGAADVIPNSTIISWNAVSGATGYTLMLSLNGIDYNNIETESGSTTSTTLDLEYGTTNYFYVRPVIGSDTASISCASNATSFSTSSGPIIPENDDCENAISLNSLPVNASTLGATQYLDAEECNGFLGNANDDVWFKFTPDNNGTVIISVTNAAAGLDAVIQAYSGTCGSLTLLACADDGIDADNETVTLLNLTAGTTYYFRVYGYDDPNDGGTFTVQLSGSALPLSMLNFRAERLGEKNVLVWTTQTEHNNKGFDLERSPDGNNFTKLDFVESKASDGNSTTTLSYQYNDTRPFAGNSYYRLKQLDKNGGFSYSNVLLLKGSIVSHLQLSLLYPNPAKSELNMILTSPANSKINFIVTDVAGRAVMKQTAQLISGDNNLQLNIAKLSPGSYIIRVVCADSCGTIIKKFVKH